MALILVVDDEINVCSTLKVLLELKGYEVITATTGLEALGKMNGQIDIILTDVMMPGMDGFELCRLIKGVERFRSIPVIMITALVDKQDRIKGIEAGADDFLAKPIDQGELLARVNMLLKVKRLHDELNHAYDTINSLASYGDEIIRTFNPLDFDFISRVDGIVNQIIKKGDNAAQRPEMMLVGFVNEKNQWHWYVYSYPAKKLQRKPVQTDIQNVLPFTGMTVSKTGYLNSAEMQKPEIQIFTALLRHHDIIIRNMVYYVSDAICVFAINYCNEVGGFDATVLNSMVAQSKFLKSLSGQIRETEDAFAYTVNALARASEVNDEDTGKHILRVSEYAAQIAGLLELSEKKVEEIRLQAPLHDVGKIHIPATILRKPGKLTDDEWKVMKRHPLYGAKIIGDHPRLNTANIIGATHHEKWDGSGYPRGLKGEQIPIEGRIVAIADQYDALRNARVYKPGFNHSTACHIITEGDGRMMPNHFDPRVLQTFVNNTGTFEEIYEKLKD
jgi:response regulator RpfG family c-di-GMP phosphodiesterase